MKIVNKFHIQIKKYIRTHEFCLKIFQTDPSCNISRRRVLFKIESRWAICQKRSFWQNFKQNSLNWRYALTCSSSILVILMRIFVFFVSNKYSDTSQINRTVHVKYIHIHWCETCNYKSDQMTHSILFNFNPKSGLIWISSLV